MVSGWIPWWGLSPRPRYPTPLTSTSTDSCAPLTAGPSPLRQRILELADQLAVHGHGELVEGMVGHLVAISHVTQEQSDWALLHGALADVRDGLRVFSPHRYRRKVGVVGSARVPEDSAVYQQAVDLSRQLAASGFEVITGAGEGVMEAANRGAGRDNSYGLNIQLPFEFAPNRYIDPRNKLVFFRYFFTRKHFLVRESDALVAMPGGVGTLDELFEVLTLIQTAKTAPIPVVLLAPDGDDYWQRWKRYMVKSVEERGMVSPADAQIYDQASSVEDAVGVIRRFYRIFHRCRFLDGERLQLLLHGAPTAEQLKAMNHMFPDLLHGGTIEPFTHRSEQGVVPGLQFHFDHRCMGRLYGLIRHLNDLPLTGDPRLEHPEQRQ
ncbi:MAG: TIGR00730 family Rossman fold protein [Synechococcus sp. SB0673_bin_10]|nr:TIGR00730 family Rossman fold protein [Synechococcus sp. SB0667_bin_8]MYI71931.1 TIGR00730 family Rossman fold protein [Synechococcus sp. SB0673_bin_10]